MFKANLKRYCLVLLLCMAVGMSANAQTTTQGSIAGTVFDATGAVVPGATVTIHNNGTNANIVLTTEGSGYYKAPLLEPGTYTVTVHTANFRDFRTNNVIVYVSQTNTIDAHLTAGGENTVVEVNAQTSIINFESPDFSGTLTQKAIQEIPMNNRRWSSLAMETPGVVSNSDGYGLISVRGMSVLQNSVLIDGADDNDAYWSEERGRTREAYSTSENAVREFTVNTGVSPAEFGRATGAIINSVTKSGTNQFHGQLYFYDRESTWAAAQKQTVHSVLNTATNHFDSQLFKPKDLRKIYGGTVGGPIIKDKLFFMYTYDQHTRIFPGVASPSDPNAFFTLPDAALPGGATCDLATGTYTGGGSATNSAACLLAAREGQGLGTRTYAQGATDYTAGINLLNTDALGNVPRAGYQEINTPKLDWQINSKERVSFLYHRLRWDSPGGVQTSATAAYATDAWGNDFVRADYGLAKLTSLLTSSISNEILYQYGREVLPETQQPYNAYTTNNLFGTGASSGNVPYISSIGTSTFAVGSPYYSYRKALPDERKWQIGDIVYWSKGNHSLKFGGDILHNWDEQNNTYESNGAYAYGSTVNYLSDLYAAQHGFATDQCGAGGAGVGTYQCFTNFYQGFGNPVFAITTTDWSAFVQDNWKFSPRLTLQIGVRYDYEHMQEPYAYLVNPAIPQTTNHPSDKNNFAPRVGFAYDVFGTGKTVLRGGYGMYYGRVLNGTILTALLDTGSSAGQYTSQILPTAGVPIDGSHATLPNIVAGTLGASGAGSVYVLDKNLQNPLAHEFDLILQQDLGKGTVFTLSYLGSLGRQLTNFLDTLNLSPSNMQTSTMTIVDTTGKSPIPNGTHITIPQYTSYTNGAYQNITDIVSNINSSYNGMAAEIQNRTSKHLQWDASYTWSHALDYGQAATTTATVAENWLDPFSSGRSNYGNSAYNVPNRFVAYALYSLPDFVRKGSALGYLVDGWSINDSFQMQSGLPYTAVVNSGRFTSGAVSTGWNGANYNLNYIPLPGFGLYSFKQPRDIVDDVRVQKSFFFKEGCSLDLLVNIFNIANHQNVSSMNTTAYNASATGATTGNLTYQSNFGTVSKTNNSAFLYTPRNVEIGAKFNF